MTVFLDYFRTEAKTIVSLSVITDNNQLVDYTPLNFEDVAEELSGTDPIVVFSRPFIPLKEFIDAEDIEDWGIRNRYFDIFHKLRNETGRELSLRQVARATLGEGPQSEVLRLQKNYSRVPSLLVTEKVHQRLSALKAVYESVLLTQSIRYYYRGTQYSLPIDFESLFDEQRKDRD